MKRNRNTRSSGSSWSQNEIDAVWLKGQKVPGFDPDSRRKDVCNAWISYSHYGNIVNKEGWEIDHTKPVTSGGTDDLSNLQPLQWENNRNKGDDWPHWDCKVTGKS